MNKRKAINRHLNKRSIERTGALVSPGLHRELVETIQRGGAKAVGKTSNARTLFRMDVAGTMMVVVYDKRYHQVVTMWPEGE